MFSPNNSFSRADIYKEYFLVFLGTSGDDKIYSIAVGHANFNEAYMYVLPGYAMEIKIWPKN